jgi:hypothetical protein
MIYTLFSPAFMLEALGDCKGHSCVLATQAGFARLSV